MSLIAFQVTDFGVYFLRILLSYLQAVVQFYSADIITVCRNIIIEEWFIKYEDCSDATAERHTVDAISKCSLYTQALSYDLKKRITFRLVLQNL